MNSCILKIIIIIGVSLVKSLGFDFSNKHSSLTWSPLLFYCDDIPQESITTYHIRVKKIDGSLIADVKTTNTFYELPSNLTVCDIYTASVRAFIEQYSSPATKTTEQNTGSMTIFISIII